MIPPTFLSSNPIQFLTRRTAGCCPFESDLLGKCNLENNNLFDRTAGKNTDDKRGFLLLPL